MNGLYRTNELIKGLLKEQGDVTMVIECRDEQLLDDNFWKKNLYPIGLVFPGQIEYTSLTTTTYIYQVVVLSQRDISKSPSTRWDGNDNMIDNLQCADNVFSYVVKKIQAMEYEDDINEEDIIFIDGLPTAERITDFGINKLDGYQMFMRLKIFNSPVCLP